MRAPRPQSAPGEPAVTVLSGFLGAGKTTLLSHVLCNSAGRRIAVIVNDMSAINVDAALVRSRWRPSPGNEARVVELTNGCICCTLRGDVVTEVEKLAAERRFDYILIESTGISEPLPVAAAFARYAPAGGELADIARLDAMVTVVDAATVIEDFCSCDQLRDRGEMRDAGDQRALVELITSQIEFANVVVAHRKNEDGAGQLGGCAEADLCRAGARPDPRSSDGIVLAAAPRAHE